MTETERLQALLTDTLRWQAVLTAELATPLEADQVQVALLQVSRATRELWRTIHDTLVEGQKLVVNASPPPMPREGPSRGL
jgi:hypothetical protein